MRATNPHETVHRARVFHHLPQAASATTFLMQVKRVASAHSCDAFPLAAFDEMGVQGALSGHTLPHSNDIPQKLGYWMPP